jgi:SpoVK/Ycf46/Vps4 family AAA+-type ATPase
LNSKKDLEIFRRARQPAPCIAFFDEIDSITLPREGELNMPLQVLKELYHSYSRGG